MFFDSRLCHSQSANVSGDERHALVLVLGQRWMRPFDGFVPSPERARELARSPLHEQLLGLGPAFDAPTAAYETPARWVGAAA